jgi:hypothetical protein
MIEFRDLPKTLYCAQVKTPCEVCGSHSVFIDANEKQCTIK